MLRFGYVNHNDYSITEVEGYLIDKYKPKYNEIKPSYSNQLEIIEKGSFPIPSELPDESEKSERNHLIHDWNKYLYNLEINEEDGCIRCMRELNVDELNEKFFTDTISITALSHYSYKLGDLDQSLEGKYLHEFCFKYPLNFEGAEYKIVNKLVSESLYLSITSDIKMKISEYDKRFNQQITEIITQLQGQETKNLLKNAKEIINKKEIDKINSERYITYLHSLNKFDQVKYEKLLVIYKSNLKAYKKQIKDYPGSQNEYNRKSEKYEQVLLNWEKENSQYHQLSFLDKLKSFNFSPPEKPKAPKEPIVPKEPTKPVGKSRKPRYKRYKVVTEGRSSSKKFIQKAEIIVKTAIEESKSQDFTSYKNKEIGLEFLQLFSNILLEIFALIKEDYRSIENIIRYSLAWQIVMERYSGPFKQLLQKYIERYTSMNWSEISSDSNIFQIMGSFEFEFQKIVSPSIKITLPFEKNQEIRNQQIKSLNYDKTLFDSKINSKGQGLVFYNKNLASLMSLTFVFDEKLLVLESRNITGGRIDYFASYARSYDRAAKLLLSVNNYSFRIDRFDLIITLDPDQKSVNEYFSLFRIRHPNLEIINQPNAYCRDNLKHKPYPFIRNRYSGKNQSMNIIRYQQLFLIQDGQYCINYYLIGKKYVFVNLFECEKYKKNESRIELLYEFEDIINAFTEFNTQLKIRTNYFMSYIIKTPDFIESFLIRTN